MATDAWKKYNTFPFHTLEKLIDFRGAGDTFKMALFTSASNANDPTVATYGALTNEVASANGYTTGGVTLSGVTLSQSTSTVTWTTANAAWTASGGSIVCRYAVIYDSTTGDAICWSLLDNTPANVTTTDGNTLTIQISPSGVFTVTGM